MKYKLLLLDDVVNLGRKGEIVDVNPGFARNFLIPKLRGIVATKSALKMQDQLKQERAEQSIKDKAEAQVLAKQISEKTFSIVVKVDVEGNMYGSVKPQDIAAVLKKSGYDFERKQIQIPHNIKKIGSVKIELSLKEGVKAFILLNVKPDRQIKEKKSLEAEVKKLAENQDADDGTQETASSEDASE
tara:strand:+ start:151 stop:711 length:561 start_codon:yes stop_codon:yes gene_type:complete